MKDSRDYESALAEAEAKHEGDCESLGDRIKELCDELAGAEQERDEALGLRDRIGAQLGKSQAREAALLEAVGSLAGGRDAWTTLGIDARDLLAITDPSAAARVLLAARDVAEAAERWCATPAPSVEESDALGVLLEKFDAYRAAVAAKEQGDGGSDE